MSVNFSLSNDQNYVSRDRIEKVSFQVPGEQDFLIQLLGDNIHQMSNYQVTEEYFPGADGSRYLMRREGRIDVFAWSNLLGRFGMWGMQQNKKWVAQVHGHTSTFMFNERSTMRAVPIGQGQGGLSLMHISIVNRCPRQQVYRGHDILSGLPWLAANVQLVGSEYRLYYDNADIPYYFWFDESPTWNSSTYQWEVPATANVWAKVPYCMEGANVSARGNATGVNQTTEWVLEGLQDDGTVISSTVTASYTVPAGTRFLQLRSNNVINAKSIQQPAIQTVTHGTASVDPEVLIDPRSLNVIIAPG